MKKLIFVVLISPLFPFSSCGNESGDSICDCPRKFKPVCGSDNVTYDNKCFLKCAALRDNELVFVYRGTCCPKNVCPMSRSPVCDNLGHTHVNECLLRHRRCIARKTQNKLIHKVHDGVCLPEERREENCAKICLAFGGPVCDSKNVTYFDECSLEKFNCHLRKTNKSETFLAHYGNCTTGDVEPSSMLKPPSINGQEGYADAKVTEILLRNTMHGVPEKDDEDELTGTNATLFENDLLGMNETEVAEEKNLEINRTSEKLRDSSIQSLRSKQGTKTSPVVLSDSFSSHTENREESHRITFKMFNSVILSPNRPPKQMVPVMTEQDKLHRNTNKTGRSFLQPFDPTKPCTASECDTSWNPVCDSKNVTHRNLCLFKYYACKMNRLDGTLTELKYEGECTESQNFGCLPCPRNEESVFVCDNRNKTHSSLCALARFNCIQRHLNQPERVLVQVGRCTPDSVLFKLKDEVCPKRCTADENPVCDEAGVTHRNLCIFQQKNCHVRKAGRLAPMLRYLRDCKDKATSAIESNTFSSDLPELIDEDVSVEIEANLSQPPPILLEMNKTLLEKQFECPKPSCSQSSGLPICDSEGYLHENICYFTYARCLAAQNGQSLLISPDNDCVNSHCNEDCSNDTIPVCGTDFKTYKNFCSIMKAKCSNEKLDILFSGHCSECLSEPCPSLSRTAPDHLFICDQEDQTRTLCEYQMLNCIVEKNYGITMPIQHIGRCCSPFSICESEPTHNLCGSDGRTYQNQCILDIENCKNSKLDIPLTKVKHEGDCDRPSDTILPFENVQSPESLEEADDCPSTCDNLYEPVCGTDEKTYSNMCRLEKEKCEKDADLSVAYIGECCSIQCENNFNPVCDNFGITHQNLCHFGKERCIIEKTSGQNISISKFDICENEDMCDFDCPKTYEPICSSQGLTLINDCELARQNCFIINNVTSGSVLVKEYDGECCPKAECQNEFAPICDSEGRTHANQCFFKQSACVFEKKFGGNLTIEHNGPCCDQPCENEFKPVCDGITTHENMCRFKIAQCHAERRNDILSLEYTGECCETPTGSCENSGRLCDSEGQTHDNLCLFKKQKCVASASQKKELSIVHAGECCHIQICEKDDSPVCDSQGGTHATLCHFQNTKCIHDKIHPNNTIQLAYRGRCCLNGCSTDWMPVCDQHGALYRNSCLFQLKSCEQKRKFGDVLVKTPCPPIQHAKHRS